MRDSGSRRAGATSARAARAPQSAQDAIAQLRGILPGLEALLAQQAHPKTLRDVWRWWSRAYRPRLVNKAHPTQLWRDYLAHELGGASGPTLTPARVEAVLMSAERAGKSPRTVNGIRGLLRKMISDAQANGLWPWANPVTATKYRLVPNRRWPILALEECRRAIDAAQGPMKPRIAMAILLGVRPGETRAMRREDVDLVEASVFVCRSNDRATTKNGRSRLLPLFGELVALLRPLVVATPPGGLLWPAKGGGLRRRDEKWARAVRAVFRRARVLEGWDRICPACATRERFAEPGPKGACSCGHRFLWSPVPRRLRGYDLRHTFTTLARRAGVSREVIRMTVGHVGDVTSRYDQLGLEEHRAELAKLTLPAKGEGPVAATTEPSGSNSPGGESERETRFELATRSLGRDGAKGQPRARLVVAIAHRGTRCPCGAHAAFVLDTADGESQSLCVDDAQRYLQKFKADAKKGGAR